MTSTHLHGLDGISDAQIEEHRPLHPNQVCIFGRVVENLDGFAVKSKRLRDEGSKPMTTRRAQQRPQPIGRRLATG